MTPTSDSINVCHVITRLIVGGAQENTILTCRGLAERGHRVTLIAGPETGAEGSLWDEASQAGCELVKLGSLRRPVHPWRDWRARNDLVRLFRRIRPDVVHTHSSKAGILARSAAAGAGVPVVMHTIHGMAFNRTQPRLTFLLYRGLERRAAKHTTAIITVSDAMIDQSVAAGVAPRERFTTIHSGMEVEVFGPDPAARRRVRAAWGVGPNTVVVGTIARLFENKGYDEIITAMSSIFGKGARDGPSRSDRLEFVWIGDGARRAEYERRLEQAGLRDRVHLTGLVRPGEIAGLVNGFDIVLHASRWEGLPRALVQGLLTEVPAISFDNDGAPEVVIPEETGLLVPYGDTRALGRAISTLAADGDLRRAMGRRGRARCLEMFDWRRMVTRIEKLYEELVRTVGESVRD